MRNHFRIFKGFLLKPQMKETDIKIDRIGRLGQVYGLMVHWNCSNFEWKHRLKWNRITIFWNRRVFFFNQKWLKTASPYPQIIIHNTNYYTIKFTISFSTHVGLLEIRNFESRKITVCVDRPASLSHFYSWVWFEL